MSTAEHVQPTGAVAGYRPSRTLRLAVELRRQFKRRRTLGVFALMVALPVILIGALQLGGSEEAQENARINLVDVATASGLNFTLFVLFATTGFFLVVVFALFFGDTVASEAQWGSLRYTLATPVPRMRFLRQKWLAALVLAVAALVTLVLVALVGGGLAFGFDDIRTPVGVTLDQGDGLARLAGMVGYLAVHLLVVGTLAFWLSTVTDAPLAAVGGAVFTMIVFAILEQVEQLGGTRNWFPTAEQFAWTHRLETPVDSAHLFRGVAQSLVYAALFTALAFRSFARRDVTSCATGSRGPPRPSLRPWVRRCRPRWGRRTAARPCRRPRRRWR